MDGKIAVISTPGAGSTFWFTAKILKQTDASKPASERFASLAGVKSIIVDDNRNSLEILRHQITSWGMEPEVAISAADALTALRAAASKHPFRVAIIDVIMPEIDGIELARIVKGDPALASTAMVFVSSVGSRKDFEARMHGLENIPWLMKPISQSSLYNSLTSILAAEDPLESRAKQKSANASKPDATAISPRLKILIAEDNPVNQKLAKLQLKKLGLEADVVSNGAEAVDAALRFPYDVILMDCQMPEMDGYDATREIRRLQASARHTTIVAMTANALQGDRDKCLAAGMDAYISKPVDVRLLAEILSTVFPYESKSPETLSGSSGVPVIESSIKSEPPRESVGIEETISDVNVKPIDESAPIDASVIAALREEGDDIVRELIELLLADAPKRIANGRDALARGDLKALEFEMHRLKGGTANFGAHRMVELCTELRQACCANDTIRAADLFRQVASEYQRVERALDDKRHQLAPATAA